jgi:hypothetical protein
MTQNRFYRQSVFMLLAGLLFLICRTAAAQGDVLALGTPLR